MTVQMHCPTGVEIMGLKGEIPSERQKQWQTQKALLESDFSKHIRKGCTGPGNTAIPGQCVEWTEQALFPSPCSKNPFNIWSPDRGRIRY